MSCTTFFLFVSVCLSLAIAANINRAVGPAVLQPLCYDDLGCYIPRPGYKKFPQSPAKVNTQFYLHTRAHSDEPELISASNLKSFDSTKAIKLIIHGFMDTIKSPWVFNMTKELLKSEDMNVIAVDWSGGNQFPYDQAAANTVIAAAVTRQLLQAMIRQGAQPQQIHLIGHSLGAHISSYIGRALPNLGRISGLDPAGPEFYTSDAADRLDSSDALFVDVLHTDGAPRMQSGFGYMGAIGHVDFYPNGGSSQPTCATGTTQMLASSLWSLVNTWNVENAANTLSCNHLSALFYYTDSINTPSPSFAYPCVDYKSFVQGMCTSCGANVNECQQAGYRASPNHTLGSLFLMTIHGIKPPHFGFHFKVTLESDPNNAQQTRGTFKVKFNDQEEAEDRLLFDQETLMRSDSSDSKTIILASNPAPLTEISLSYQKAFTSGFGMGNAGEWRFRSATVLDLQSNISYKLCPASDSSATIKSGSRLTYTLCA